MSRVRGKDTSLELRFRSALHARGLRFRKHSKKLAGCPDAVFATAKVAVFIDGDFWHGFRYPRWKSTLRAFWQRKIEQNRARDQRNFQRLRRMGWVVLRIWQHQIEDDIEMCLARVSTALKRAGHKRGRTFT